VWQRLSGAFNALDRVVDARARPRLQAMVRALAAPALHRMGWVPAGSETEVERQRRAVLFELLGTIGADGDVRTRARALHETYLKDPDLTAPELVAAAVTVIADSGTPDEFHAFQERWREPSDPQEQMRYLYALGRFHDDECFREMLEFSLAEVRTQNAPFLLARAMTNRTHGPVAWQFVRQHWSEIIEKFPASTIVRMAEGIKWLTSVAPDIEAFFAEHEVPQSQKTMAQHLERLRINLAFTEREREAFSASLAK
jgi:puromycin-sensitive aminopeptidase